MENYINIHTEFIKELLLNENNNEAQTYDLQTTEEALIQYAQLHRVEPASHIRQSIMNRITGLTNDKNSFKQLDINQLPLLDEHSNWLEWSQVVEHVQPPAHYSGIYLHPIESNNERDLFIVWVKEFVPDEVHHDLLESFLILEGTCECLITSPDGNTRKVRLGEGEFITMQLGETHHINITSHKPAKAILQWKKLAA